ncbi:DUF1413 domain-containing protein [Burkholderia glumae]
MSDEVFERLRLEAKAAGFPGISSYLLSKVEGLTDAAEAEDIVKQALQRARRRPPGEPFRLKDLFPAERWDGFSKSARLSAGRRFHGAAKAGTAGLEVAAKTASNHQTYVRTEDL